MAPASDQPTSEQEARLLERVRRSDVTDEQLARLLEAGDLLERILDSTPTELDRLLRLLRAAYTAKQAMTDRRSREQGSSGGESGTAHAV
ncbi:hypothetical protein KY386_00915 [Candidatus Parcubacteria bacterium]|nr:hypothetical protein [Candidatus Parcubacteria bacterium]